MFSTSLTSTKKDALAQQENVQLKRKKKHQVGTSSTAVKPVSLILVSTAAIFLVSVIVTLRFFAVMSLEDDSSSLQKPTLNKVLRAANNNNNGNAAAAAIIPPVHTSDDMDVVFREYHKHPQLGATAVFAGTASCLAKAHSSPDDHSCQLILPMDTADQTSASPPYGLDQNHHSIINIALRTWKGKKSVIGVDKNQDRSIMILFDSTTFGKSSLLLLADGHGETGHVIAEEVIKDLPLRILKAVDEAAAPADEATIHQLLKTTILETDKMLLDEIDADGGATLVLILHMGDTLYLASAGDSTATVMEWKSNNKNNNNNGEATELRTAVRHKPMDPAERTRIEAAGGQVIQNFGDPSSRVIVPSPKGRMFDMALAMSRCMGDRDGKVAGLLTAEPSVLTVDLKEHTGKQLFVIVSSDGVTDMFPLPQLAARIGSAMFSTNNNNNKNALQQQQQENLEAAVDESLQQSSSVWLSHGQPYRDDMTLMVAQVATAV